MERGDEAAKGRTERKKRETRQKIIKAALDLIQQQGFDKTTMEQIAEEADVARKTLYNYFPVKEAIIDEYVRGLSRKFTQEVFTKLPSLPDTRSRLLESLDKVYEQVEINPELIGISLGYRLKNMLQGGEYQSGGTQGLIAEIIRLGRQAGEIRQDIKAELLVKQLDILRGAVVMDWLNDPSRVELRREMALLVDLFLNGAAGEEGKSI